MIMAIQEGCSPLTCIPTLSSDSRSAASIRLIMQLTLSECNRSKLASLKLFALILVGNVIALWRLLRNKQWAVLIRTRPMLHNARHRAMVTPVSPLCTRLIHISPIYKTIYHSFGIEMFYANLLLQKTINLMWIKFQIIFKQLGFF